MSRNISPKTLQILKYLQTAGSASLPQLKAVNLFGADIKSIQNALFRLCQAGWLEKQQGAYKLTPAGVSLLERRFPKKDGVWKLIIFDIPEEQKSVRNFLRNRLAALGFKKWQNSIWVSPYQLDPRLEEELGELAKKYFVRLIKTSDINYTEELDEMFDVMVKTGA